MAIDTRLAVTKVTPDIVEYVVRKIIDTVHPARIILFGSQARCTNGKDSDIDMLVVTRPGQNREEVRLAIEQTLRGRRFGIDLLVRTPEDMEWNLEGENPFYTNEILQEGRIMYEH